MRRIVIGAVVVLLFILLLAGIVLKVLHAPAPGSGGAALPTSPSATTATGEPDKFVEAFYTWYIQEVEADPQFPQADSIQTTLGQWLTPRFVSSFAQEGDVLDADPVLWAQDNPKMWGPGIVANTVSEDASTTVVHVTIGTGTTAHFYTVQLQKIQNAWKIDAIAGNLPH